MRKRRNRVYRRIAMALTVALLAGQSHAFVLAEEDAGGAPQMEITGEADTSTPDNGSETGGSNTDNGSTENGGGEGNGGSEQGGNDGADDQNPEDNGNNGDQQGDGDDQTSCICGTKCAADVVNTDCPVCAADYEACTGKADDAGNDDPGNSGQDQCVCETACTEEAVNVDCPVCAADYANCAKRAGERVNSSVDAVLSEMTSGNMADEEADIAVLAAESDAKALGAGRRFTYLYQGTELKYKVQNDATVEIEWQGSNTVKGDVVIPKMAQDGFGAEYLVTGIGERGFHNCYDLKSVVIPDSVKYIGDKTFELSSRINSVTLSNGVTSIGERAFYGCGILDGLTLPDSVTSIGREAFSGCKNLTSITMIPGGVTSIEEYSFANSGLISIKILDGVKSIGKEAFDVCKNLTSVTIPSSVTSIGEEAFLMCESLTSVTIPNSVTSIENYTFGGCKALKDVTISDQVSNIHERAFSNCAQLQTMWVIVTSNGVAVPPEIENDNIYGWTPFNGCTTDREIVFQAADGVTREALENARNAYLEAGKTDDDPDDGKWYGWTIRELPEKADTYKVAITVQKDDSPWMTETGCDRIFALTKDGGTTFVTNLDMVEKAAEAYTIYDVTGLTADEYKTKGMNTGVTVTVADADVLSTDPVNYYTVAFCYLDDDGNEQTYGDSTDWKPQTILKTVGRVAVPATNPTKEDHAFDKWVTAQYGDDAFAFAATPITAAGTKIYAKWTKNTAIDSLRIQATATEGGTIAPKDEVIVSKGGERTFTITPDEGNKIKAVTVDKEDVTAELKDTLARAQTGARYYTFTNVTKDHTIHAEFERDGSSSGGEDNPGSGGDNPGGDNPGGGGDNPDPGGDNPGSGSGGGGGDHSNPDSGGNNGGGRINGGDNTNPDGVNGTETSSAQAGGGAAVASADNNAASDGSKAAGASGGAANGKEPKTGDASYLEVYATLAMIAGLTYLLLYVMEESRGMSEREKEAFVAAFIRWGKKGGTFRKCCAMAAIFCLLAYYHIIGKNVGANALREKHLGQAF